VSAGAAQPCLCACTTRDARAGRLPVRHRARRALPGTWKLEPASRRWAPSLPLLQSLEASALASGIHAAAPLQPSAPPSCVPAHANSVSFMDFSPCAAWS